MEYKYSLAKTKTMQCPRCGAKKRFKPYVDADGRILDPSVGRCNREFHCGYHYPPRDFFRDNPIEAARLAGHAGPAYVGPRGRSANEPDERPLPPQPDFIDKELVDRTLPECRHAESINPLRHWMLTIFSPEAVAEVFSLYRVGDAKRYGGAAIFWYIDSQNRTRSGKIMAYGPDGHRLKGDRPSVCFVHGLVKKDFNYAMCYFGTHLTAAWPDAKVIMVESEKTALILACWLHQKQLFPSHYIPVASGGCSNFAIDHYRVDSPYDPGYFGNEIRKRHMIVIPDADAHLKWFLKSDSWRIYCRSFRMFDIRPYAATDSDDIADILLRRLAAQPQPAQEAAPKMEPGEEPVS